MSKEILNKLTLTDSFGGIAIRHNGDLLGWVVTNINGKVKLLPNNVENKPLHENNLDVLLDKHKDSLKELQDIIKKTKGA